MSVADKSSELNNDLVSIIMPNYNSEKFICETIESVIAQTYEDWELIIVDDCSTDHSVELIERFNDTRIHLIKSETNSGAAISRNIAIDAANGRWIAFLDSDDVWDKNKLLHHVRFMAESGAAFSFTHYSVVNSKGEQITVFTPGNDEYEYSDILKHCYIGCSTVIYDRAKLGKVYMPIEAVKREDFACWLQILKRGENAVCLHESLTAYRIHGNSVSSNKIKMVSYQWNVYRNVEGLALIRSVYYMINWAIRGFLKYK